MECAELSDDRVLHHDACAYEIPRGGVVLRLGAKARNIAGMPIEDPRGLLQWLAKDRAIVTFVDAGDVQARGPAFQSIVRQWINHV
jgi:hypothetical protein